MQNSVAKRYAKGLYDAVAAIPQNEEGKNNQDAFISHLDDLKQALNQSSELKAILNNPAVSFDDRRQLVRIIAQKAGWHRLFANFVCLLIDRNRLRLLDPIAEAFSHLVDAQHGMLRLEITSARPLGTIEVQKLVSAVSSRHNQKNVEVTTHVDPALIGGAIARLGEHVYDASIRSQLDKVRRTILQSL